MAELGRETGTAIILVTHDLGVVARLCDRVVVLYGGRVMEEAPAETLFDAPAHPYTRGLLAAMPRLETALTPRLGTIPGTPRSGSQAKGCPFVDRCDLRLDRCATDRPALRELGATHSAACHLTGAAP